MYVLMIIIVTEEETGNFVYCVIIAMISATMKGQNDNMQ